MPPTESDLIARVKGAQDSAALTALVHANSGIYFSVVNRYAAAYPNVIKKDDMDDEKMLHIWTFVKAYDPTRGTKLSTFVHDRTDYLCKTMLREGSRDPLMGAGTPSGVMHFDQSMDTFATTAGTNVTLIDESDTAQVVETANHDLALEEVLAAAWSVCEDKRFVPILNHRHFSAPGVTMSWREIGEKVGLSHEGARKVYNVNMNLVRTYLKEKAA